jgi:hypothetical protein
MAIPAYQYVSGIEKLAAISAGGVILAQVAKAAASKANIAIGGGNGHRRGVMAEIYRKWREAMWRRNAC